MLVSHTKKFIYLKTIKTAGTSVESYFEKYCMPENCWELSHQREEYVGVNGIVGYRGPNPDGRKWFNHMSAAKVRSNLEENVWNDYFKFCVIRNPFDKLISGFFFFEKQKQNLSRQKIFKNKIKKIVGRGYPIDFVEGSDPITRFRSWIKHGGYISDRDKYVIDGKNCIDYFIRYEDLKGGIEHVCKQLDIPFEPDRILNLKAGIRDKKKSIGEFYDDETIQIVNTRYKFELENFGYSL